MALIPVVGRRSLAVRLGILFLYVILSIGAVTTVYPFMMMIGESFTSDYDKSQFDVVPKFLYSTPSLFGKYSDDKFGGDNDLINANYGTSFAKAEEIVPPSTKQLASADYVTDWDAFFKDQPLKFKQTGFNGIPSIAYSPAPLTDLYQAFLKNKFHGNIRALDTEYLEEDESFATVVPPFEAPASRSWLPDNNQKTADWKEFEQTLPTRYFKAIRGDSSFSKWLREEAYDNKLADLNKAWGTNYAAFSNVLLTVTPDGNAVQRKDWQTFVRTKMPLRFAVVDKSATVPFQKFIAGRYRTIADFNKAYGQTVATFTDIQLPSVDNMHTGEVQVTDWQDFLKLACPDNALTVDTLESRYRAHLIDKFHLAPSAAAAMIPPIYSADWQYVQAHTGELRNHFIGCNYKVVIDYFTDHTSAISVTVIFCLLAVVTALIVNPLCAYALSRFNLSYGTAVLLFLLATMSFPTDITQIPNFLLLKQLGMLNTFCALILPGVASGYWIFLLKGFFDSLPKELYEAGTLDGATEVKMFFDITIPLSKPVFAVIGLNAFTAAYGAFLFAILYCQNPKMWTLMVWIYELQAKSAPMYVMLAALTLASLPMLIVFIFAQNTIMKGIIIPSYK